LPEFSLNGGGGREGFQKLLQGPAQLEACVGHAPRLGNTDAACSQKLPASISEATFATSRDNERSSTYRGEIKLDALRGSQ
jgi:hypothetical protein